MIGAVLYTRPECHLCDQVKEDLESLREAYTFEIIEVNIDQDDDLQKEYGMEIPVVKIGPYTLKAPITREELKVTLGAATDRQAHIEKIDRAAREIRAPADEKWTSADGFTLWVSRHYMFFFNLLVVVYLGLPILAPVLMKAGITLPANWIYRAYSTVCHQLAYRSFFIFGEQLVCLVR